MPSGKDLSLSGLLFASSVCMPAWQALREIAQPGVPFGRCRTVCSIHSSTATAHLLGAGCGTKASRCVAAADQAASAAHARAGEDMFLALHVCLCRLSSACRSAAVLGIRPSMSPQQQEPTCWSAMGAPMHRSQTQQSTHDMWHWDSSCCLSVWTADHHCCLPHLPCDAVVVLIASVGFSNAGPCAQLLTHFSVF